jgi:type I restriction enzyme, S subunit
MKYEMVKLGDYVKPITGKTPPTSQNDYFDGDILWVTPSDFKSKYIETTNRTLTNKAIKDKKCNALPENTLVLSCIGDIGKVGILRQGGTTNQQITALITNAELDNDFLYYCLINKKAELNKLANKAVVPILNNERLKTLEIPLPPLSKQREIAHLLDKADALRRKDRALLIEYDALAQAIFMDMFGDPVQNEKGWEMLFFGNCLKDIVAGSSFGGEAKTLDADELGVLKISAVTSGFFRAEEYKAVKKSSILKDVIFVREGDLLFSRANTRELVGATCLVDKDYDDLFLPDKLWRLDVKKDVCTNGFVKYLLSQASVRYELNKTATGTSGSMLNISMQKLKELPVIMPPIDLQIAFEQKMKVVAKKNQLAIESINHSESLFQTLLQTSFS